MLLELPHLENFQAVLVMLFTAAVTTYLDALKPFKTDPMESLHMLRTRFHLIIVLLEGATLMTSEMPALSLMKHPLGMVRMGTIHKIQVVKAQQERCMNSSVPKTVFEGSFHDCYHLMIARSYTELTKDFGSLHVIENRLHQWQLIAI